MESTWSDILVVFSKYYSPRCRFEPEIGTAEDRRWDVPSVKHPPLAQRLGRSQPATSCWRGTCPRLGWEGQLTLGGEMWVMFLLHSHAEECHKVLPSQQESNPTWSKPHFKSTPDAIISIWAALLPLSSQWGPVLLPSKHDRHLANFIFIVIQLLQGMPGYLYHLPQKCHLSSKSMVDTWGLSSKALEKRNHCTHGKNRAWSLGPSPVSEQYWTQQ